MEQKQITVRAENKRVGTTIAHEGDVLKEVELFFKTIIPPQELDSYKKTGTGYYKILRDKMAVTKLSLSPEALAMLFVAIRKVLSEYKIQETN